MKKMTVAMLAVFALAGCNDADIASRNMSKAADNFEIVRRIIFYNGITEGYMLEIVGRCSLGNYDSSKQLSVTCKTGPGAYKKHYLGLSDNVTYFVEQLEVADVSVNHYRVTFKPQTIIPDFDLRGDPSEAVTKRPQ
jgi:hypothetical protein